MKKIIKISFCFFITAFIMLTVSVANASAEYSFGDVNGDQLIDAVDASQILSEYALISTNQNGKFTDIQKNAGDIDKNGLINAVDASKILSYYSYISTGGTLSIDKYINVSEIGTTATTTMATTSSRTIATTTSQASKTGYTKYDLLNPDNEIAAKAFEKLSNELREEMYGHYIVTGAWGISNGADQARVILAALNYDQGISPEVLASDEALGTYSQDELIQNCEALDFAGNGYNRLDYNKYMLNDELANYIRDLIEKFDNWYNGNQEPLYEELEQYQERYRLRDPEPDENCIKRYMYSEIYYYTRGMSHVKSREFLANNVVIPMYQNFEQYIKHSYV